MTIYTKIILLAVFTSPLIGLADNSISHHVCNYTHHLTEHGGSAPLTGIVSYSIVRTRTNTVTIHKDGTSKTYIGTIKGTEIHAEEKTIADSYALRESIDLNLQTGELIVITRKRDKNSTQIQFAKCVRVTK